MRQNLSNPEPSGEEWKNEGVALHTEKPATTKTCEN